MPAILYENTKILDIKWMSENEYNIFVNYIFNHNDTNLYKKYLPNVDEIRLMIIMNIDGVESIDEKISIYTGYIRGRI